MRTILLLAFGFFLPLARAAKVLAQTQPQVDVVLTLPGDVDFQRVKLVAERIPRLLREVGFKKFTFKLNTTPAPPAKLLP